MAHPEQELIDAIVDRIRFAIDGQPEGDILSSGDAFRLASDTVAQSVAERGLVMNDGELRRFSRDVQYEAYQSVRLLVAAQLRGLTLQDLIATTEHGVVRFLGKSELEIAPKPTKAFSGYCEPHDVWNLLCNLFEAGRKARETEVGAMTPDDIRLAQDMKRCEQLLLLLNEHDVPLEDVDGKPYDGSVRDPQWLPAWRRAASEAAISA
jgi:hypothetical protein